ncbi:MAG: hemagglutinin repeat-containing protein [Neisseriaceae bacterium]|nr:hemagglutinin repeat-containing protein [Neisseriaceae bacterium]
MSNAQNNTQHKPKTVIYSENGDVNIQAAQNFYNTEEERTVKKSGLLGTGGIGFTIGQQKTKTESDNTALIHSSSMVGSLGGDTQIYAGKNYSQVGSTVSSVGGETTISADKVDIVAAQNRNEDKYKQTFEQKGLTIALSSAITDLAQSAYGVAKSAEKVGKSKNNRVNAMAAFNTGYGAYSVAKDAGKMMGVGQGASAANGKNPQGSGSAVKVSITYGQQKNTQESNSISTAAQASEVFGDKVNITARKDDINIIGSDVSGSTNTDLSAAKNVNIASFEEIYTNRSQNKSFGWNAGVAVEFGQGMSFGFTGGANYGKGHENADSTTHRNSHVGSTTGKTTITAGETLNIKGGQVAGKGVDITAKDLNIESLQDTMTYDSRQENISGSVTVGYGVSGSASYSKSKVNADYASVNEQSGIFAGDDGYQINVQNHTDLKGGLITSTDRAEMDGKNSFSTGTISFADIANRSKYSGSSFGVGLSGSMGGGERMPKEVGGQKLMTLGSNNSVMTGEKDENGSYKTKEVGAFSASKTVGFGRDSDSQSSVTRSGINTANITVSNGEKQKQLTGKSVEETIAAVKTDITTDNYAENSGSLKNNFDAQEVQAEIDLQREVRQDFDQNRQAVKKDLYAIVDKKRAEAEKERKEHGGRETEKSKKLDQEANDLDEKVRWIDMGLGLVWGGGNSDMAWSMYATTQADRAYRAGTAPKEMWYQKKVVDEKTGEVTIDKRQIWSLNDLTPEEQASIRDEQGNVITVSNPGILNNREDALKNAAKQNLESTNKNGVIVVMNPATGKYGSDNWTDKLWLISTLPSELIYVGYDQINNKFFQGVLPKTNSEELNQEIYQQAKDMGYMIDTSNHSRGGITASVALKDWVRQHKDEKDGAAPIRKARFYGTATNVQNDYADVLQKNGYTYQGADGQTYNSGAYSIVHKMDFVGNKWIPFLLGNNETSPYNNCKGVCYSHSSYFAEVPEQYERDKNGQIVIKNGNPVVTKDWEDYTQKWGKPEKGADGKYINHAIPELVKPNNQKGEKYENKPF